MITLHEAIRNVQEELIKSQQEREQMNMPKLFVTDKLTIELSCVFSKTDSTDGKGGINVLSVLAFDAESTKSVSSEEIQKITLEFKTAVPGNTQGDGGSQNAENAGSSAIPTIENAGFYPYDDNH